MTVEEGDLQFHAVPEEERSDGHAFAAPMGDGREWTVEFVETDGDTALLWSREPRTIRFDER